MVVILAGSMPAAFMLPGRLTAVGCHWPTPEPESTMMNLSPTFKTITVRGIGMYSVVIPALASAALVSSTLAFLMNAGSCGFFQIPS